MTVLSHYEVDDLQRMIDNKDFWIGQFNREILMLNNRIKDLQKEKSDLKSQIKLILDDTKVRVGRRHGIINNSEVES